MLTGCILKTERKEKQTLTSKKHDKNCFKDKNVEDSQDLDILKQLNDTLLEKVKNNEKQLKVLKRKRKNMRKILRTLNKN